jgi:hypothetical protein
MKALRADSPVNIQSPDACPHDRIYTWFPREIANDPDSYVIACHGCCDCGTGWTTNAPKGTGGRGQMVPWRDPALLTNAT